MLFIPFIYFLKTRLNSFKAIIFQIFFEWTPSILLVYYSSISFSFVPEWLAYYLAFVCIYEIGYLVNDQIAFHREAERRRARLFTRLEISVFIAIRIVTFLFISYITKAGSSQWWSWYLLLIFVFSFHNILRQNALKIITFSYLTFARFFSPIIILIGVMNVNLLLPISIHYVLFRLITYMDSKNLIGFNRQTNFFRITFHLLGGVISFCLTLITNAYMPLWISAYYILISVGFGIIDTYFLDAEIE